ncbi:MAG: alpha/beta fold hydrolase [Armatimonadetes bacterium]|nr:alpha/beta fold hydrolase [Armatimonadota bacterium]
MFATVKDLRIAYEDTGGGPPILLLHGFPLNRHMWRPQVEALAARYRVIAPDFRGHGESDAPPGPYSMEQFARDVHTLIHHHLGVEGKLVVGGLSMGGYVAFRFVERYPEHVHALILADTRAEADSEEGRERRMKAIAQIETEGPAPFLEGFLKALVAPTTPERAPDVVVRLREMMAWPPAHSLTATLRALADRPDSTPLLSTIKVPTLIIVGEEDVPTPADSSRTMHQAVAGSRLTVIPNVGHMSNLEDPEAFNRALVEFLGGVGTW